MLSTSSPNAKIWRREGTHKQLKIVNTLGNTVLLFHEAGDRTDKRWRDGENEILLHSNICMAPPLVMEEYNSTVKKPQTGTACLIFFPHRKDKDHSGRML